ncbi:MED6 mediator sub complex component-domain-containing protein [Mucidula mucida]|nr:MED6 mediator sub complex component-domain-containing protein [Mucidula mucida]
MDVNDFHPQDDHSTRFFIWHEWIQAHGPLTAESVFEYFTNSQFYDKQSNNQVLRMQTMHTGMPVVNEAEELKRFTGIEFAVVHAEPPSFFIIHKRERLSPEQVQPLAVYFVSENRIFQSPDLYTLLSNRLLASLRSIQSSLNTLRSHRPDYTPRTGFAWPITNSELTDAPTTNRNEETADAEVKDGAFQGSNKIQRQQNNSLLFNAMRATAVHSQSRFSTAAFTTMASSITTEPQAPSPAPAPQTAAASRSSATPAPGPTQAATPKPPPVPGPPGGGKKKRKRTLAPAPP